MCGYIKKRIGQFGRFSIISIITLLCYIVEKKLIIGFSISKCLVFVFCSISNYLYYEKTITVND